MVVLTVSFISCAIHNQGRQNYYVVYDVYPVCDFMYHKRLHAAIVRPMYRMLAGVNIYCFRRRAWGGGGSGKNSDKDTTPQLCSTH